MLFNQQQCFIYSTASFLSKLRAKKVEKLRILVIKQLQQTTAYRKFENTGIGFRNPERLFPVLPIVKQSCRNLFPVCQTIGLADVDNVSDLSNICRTYIFFTTSTELHIYWLNP